MRRIGTIILAILLVLGVGVLPAQGQQAATQPTNQQQQTTQIDPNSNNILGLLPDLNLGQDGEEEYGLSIQLLLLLTVLSMAPAIILLMTSFTRIAIVLGMIRNAIGMQNSPPNQVILGLAMFLTLYTMYPVFDVIHQEAVVPLLEGKIEQQEALDIATTPLKKFMLSQTRDKELLLFQSMANLPAFNSVEDVPLYVLVPAYVISELRIAFQIGFMLFLPFLVIDLVVASVLMSMGMMMLPPVMISLPIKILLFVLTDGWLLIVESIVASYY